MIDTLRIDLRNVDAEISEELIHRRTRNERAPVRYFANLVIAAIGLAPNKPDEPASRIRGEGENLGREPVPPEVGEQQVPVAPVRLDRDHPAAKADDPSS